MKREHELKSPTLSSLLGAMLVLVFGATGRCAEELPAVPERFSAYIGGFMGASYGIELRGGTLTYTSSERGHRNTRHARIAPTAAEWREFRETIDDLKVWQWRADYPSRGTVDGTQWSLDIAYTDHTAMCRGDNSYPDANGKPNGKPEPTPTFNRYLAAIKKLIGGRDFQ